MQNSLNFTGSLKARKISPKGPGLLWKLRNNFTLPFMRGFLACKVIAPIAAWFGLLVVYGELKAMLIRADGTRIFYGVISRRVVTTAFAELMVDQLQTETSVWGDFKYHDSGVGTTGAAVGDTDIETTDGESRATGTQTENTSVIYESVGTISYTTTKAITEHGLFNASTGPTLLDRHTFTAINVINGDSIQFTYDLTVTAGG